VDILKCRFAFDLRISRCAGRIIFADKPAQIATLFNFEEVIIGILQNQNL
jgi:hypothetical protein